MKESIGQCIFCGRKNIDLTEHHFVPKSEHDNKKIKKLKLLGKICDFDDTVSLCQACHSTIHAIYSNKELANNLNTKDKLIKDEKINKFIQWIKNKPNDLNIQIDISNSRGKKYG